MTKTCKKILLSVFFALLFVLCLGAFAACGGGGGGGGNEVTYTVTVMKDEITPAKDVEVRIRKNKNVASRKTTDENGKAEFKILPNDYTVELGEKTLPLSYGVPSNATYTLSKDKHDCTVTLERVGYIVKLVNPDGTPYYSEGVMVTICEIDGDECKNPVLLGEDGVAYLTYPNHDYSKRYHVKVLSLPKGAKYDWDEKEYYTGQNFSATVRDMTIVISTASNVNLAFTKKMSDTEKTAYAKDHAIYTEEAQQFDAYRFTNEIAANATVYFSFTPEISGVYHLYKNNTLSYVNMTPSSGGYLSSELICEAGKAYTFTATNNSISKVTAEFVFTVPFSSFVQHSGTSGTLDLTIGKAGTYAIVEFTPTSGALYTATVQGTASACVKAFTSKPNEFIGNEIPSDDYKTGASGKYAIPYGTSTFAPIYFAVAVKANKYPVEITLQIEKGAESESAYAEVTETLTAATKPDGVLCGIPMDGTSAAKLTYDADKKAYRYGESGPIVYVKLTKALDADRFSSGCSLAYMELTSTYLPRYTINSVMESGAILTTDYAKFLRGFTFEQYKKTQSMQSTILAMPDKAVYEDENCYANYVNEDGAYPLTKELKAFLEAFYKTNKDTVLTQTGISANTAQANDAWLFPCYYYGEGTSITTDAIVGEYTKFIKGYEDGKVVVTSAPEGDPDGYKLVDNDEYKLVVNSNNTFTVYNKNGNEAISGDWNKEGETYTFTVPDAYTAEGGAVSDLHFTVAFNDSTKHITLTGVENNKIVWEFELN